MNIAITGPATPADLVDYLEPTSARLAPAFTGLGGRPLVELTAGLIARGHHVTLITLARGFTGNATLIGPSLTLHVGPFRAAHRARDAFHVERAYVTQTAKHSRADILHAHWTYEFALGALASGRPALITAHDAPLKVLWHHRDPYRLVRAGMAMLVARQAQNMTAVSPYIADHFRGPLGARCPISVIPSAISDDLFLAPPTQHAARPGHTIATVLNGFDRLKNSRRAIEAFAAVRQILPDSRLLMIGDDYDSAGPAAAWARRHNLHANIDFAGPIPHTELLQRLASDVDVLLHPSLEESQSLILCEALALGTPIVAGSHSGAVPWTLDHGNSGILADVRSPAAIADALVRLLLDPARRAQFAAAGQASSRKRFAMNQMLAAYEVLYQKVAA
jgi:L-malate glycosyltransferase